MRLLRAPTQDYTSTVICNQTERGKEQKYKIQLLEKVAQELVCGDTTG